MGGERHPSSVCYSCEPPGLSSVEKFLREFLRPLLPKVGRRHDENAAFTLRPFLGEHEPASMVFPNPTSSARMAPFESGDLNANKAAST